MDLSFKKKKKNPTKTELSFEPSLSLLNQSPFTPNKP